MKANGLENMLGENIGLDYQNKIKDYIENPSFDKWDEIAGIVIAGYPTETIWQCICSLDPTFPKRGRATDLEGNTVREWERIPHPFLVRRALKLARKSNDRP